MDDKFYMLFGTEYRCDAERLDYFKMYNSEQENTNKIKEKFYQKLQEYKSLDELVSNLYFDTCSLITECLYNIKVLIMQINNVATTDEEIYQQFIRNECIRECVNEIDDLYDYLLTQCAEL